MSPVAGTSTAAIAASASLAGLSTAVPTPTPGYSDADRQRFLAESGKDPQRTAFERDRARVLHSSGLRRLGAKTQVLGPSSDDFVRTRLTHSLEVAQVGRTLGHLLGCDPDVVDTACLSHDLGHPPYGHNGETALNTIAKDIGGFEGNAQTFRLLTRLEPKAVLMDWGSDGELGLASTQLRSRSVGLNLTRASLDAVAKYPWQRGQGPGGMEGKSGRKYSCYEEDRELFEWMRQGAPALRRCLEAQVMDFSDDVGYSVHDVEDAIALGRMDPERLGTTSEVDKVVASTLDWYGSDISADALVAAWQRLSALPRWIGSYNGSLSDAAELKNMTSELIGRFVSSAAQATRERYGDGALTRYDADLMIPDETAAEILFLKGAAVHYVMAPREFEPVYLRQRTELFDLADVLMETGAEHLEPMFANAWREAGDEAARTRVVVDQLASLTDTSARQWHARLCGMFSSL